MALTYNAAEQFKTSVGGRFLTATTVTFDTEYPTGGYELNGAYLGLTDGHINVAWVNGPAIPAGGATGYVAKIVNGKLQLYQAAAAANSKPLEELANKTDVHTISAQVIAVGW